MDDLISRQAAIDAIKTSRYLVDAMEKIIKLPSAQPERKIREKENRMRTIDADALIAQMEADAEQMVDPVAQMFTYGAIHEVRHAPTIEPERKTGVWLDDDENGKVMTSGYCPYCSVCKEMAECITKYCPHCGAKMEGVE